MDCNFTLCKRYLNGNCIKQVGEKCQLEQVKEIIDNLLSDNRIMKAQFESEEQAQVWFKHIEQAEQFLEYDKIPNCLGTQTTSGN